MAAMHLFRKRRFFARDIDDQWLLEKARAIEECADKGLDWSGVVAQWYPIGPSFSGLELLEVHWYAPKLEKS